MTADCIFCQIAAKKIPVPLVHEDETVVAIKDKFPQAPVHLLVIPKKHVTGLNELSEKELSLISHIFSVAQKLSRQFKIAEPGYRTVFNTNPQGGQSVFHLHLHILGGKQLGPSMVG
ncbi:MAG: histidine triad nucleotide-binding protein [Deltaproteobacteria bacterium]|nr:histidine triad nucleotide-binding protein [Deltaproteobacteria bacterium]